MENLAKIRCELGLSQKRMALYCKMPVATYRQIESLEIQPAEYQEHAILRGVVIARRDVVKRLREEGNYYGRREPTA